MAKCTRRLVISICESGFKCHSSVYILAVLFICFELGTPEKPEVSLRDFGQGAAVPRVNLSVYMTRIRKSVQA